MKIRAESSEFAAGGRRRTFRIRCTPGPTVLAARVPLKRDLVRPLAGPVAGRIIVADPHLAPSASRLCASNFGGFGPDDLRVMPAHAATSVGAVVVVPGFRGPRVDHLRG